MTRLLLLAGLAAALLPRHAGAESPAPRPLLGAQVWIEPGQTPAQIDAWFRTLDESGMPVARLFMMWNQMETAPGAWDFGLYDLAFRAAERHHVRIVATLTAHHGPPFRGYPYRSQGSKIVDTNERLVEAEDYIARVVSRYRTSPALDTWMLMNEPGQAPAPDPLAIGRFREWLEHRYGSVEKLNAAWLTAFASFEAVSYDPAWAEGGWTWPTAFLDWHAFWREHLTWHLDWVARQVRRHDPAHAIHVNPHALVDNLSGTSHDLPSWRAFLDSLGASIHPGWHFGLLRREQFALGVGYVCDLVAGASEPKPFWVTELQGGNNLYSASRPMNPTPADLAQWLWTGLGAGADRVVFWLLNARAQGGEAAEWSLLDFQGRPSERLREAAAVARVLRENDAFFAGARPVEPRVTVVVSLDAMTLQDTQRWTDLAGRERHAHLRSALAAYEALAELGVPARVKHLHDVAWDQPSAAPQVAILPHVTALSDSQAKALEIFVRGGHTLLVTGLSGFFHPDARARALSAGSALDALLGARLKELRLVADRSTLALDEPRLALPFHLWQGEIDPAGARVIGRDGERVTAVRHALGKGEVVWIPSLVDLAAWLGERAPYAQLLASLVAPAREALPVTFAERQPGVVLRLLQNGTRTVAVVTNGEDAPKTVRLAAKSSLARVLYAHDATLAGTTVTLGPRGTAVLEWGQVLN